MKRSVLLIGLVASLFIVAACGGEEQGETTLAGTDTTAPDAGTETTAPTEQTTVPDDEGSELEATEIRIAMGSPEIDSLTVGKWIELIEAEGITILDVEFASGANAFRAMAAGEADMNISPPAGILQWVSQRPGGVEVLAAQILKPDYVLMVTPDIETLEDIEGKQIGISVPGDISHALTVVALDRAGIDTSTIEFVQIGGTSARIAALTEGQISGGAAHVVDGLAAAEQSDLRPLLNYWESIPTYAFHFLQARSDWLEEHPTLAQLMVDKLLEANRWATDNEEDFVELAGVYAPDFSEDLVREVYQLFNDNGFFAPNGGLDAIDTTVEIEQAMGALGEVPDISEWVNSTFVDDYLEREGTYSD